MGICKFIGGIRGKKGLYFGIELKDGDGKNSGCVKKDRYFRTTNNKRTGTMYDCIVGD